MAERPRGDSWEKVRQRRAQGAVNRQPGRFGDAPRGEGAAEEGAAGGRRRRNAYGDEVFE